jgi:hypothetical protein
LRVLAHPDDFVPLYNRLKDEPRKNKAMLEAIDNVKQRLENSDQPLGAHHKRENIPKPYLKRYDLQSLYHFDMPSDYRLIYTIRRSPTDGLKEALFLELLSHDEYNKLFDYFKKKSH